MAEPKMAAKTSLYPKVAVRKVIAQLTKWGDQTCEILRIEETSGNPRSDYVDILVKRINALYDAVDVLEDIE